MRPRSALFLGPAHVDLDFTNACNLGCRHCHSASGKRLPGELSTIEFQDVFRQLHQLGAMTITVAGGEPFVRRDAIEILEYACALSGWTVTVVTNGTLLTERLLKQLARRCPTLRLNVSIDGSTPERFARLRHYAASSPVAADRLFRRVTAATRRAVEAGFPVQINFTLARATADDIHETYALAVDELGAEGMLAIKFFPAGYGIANLAALDFPYDEWAGVFRDLTRHKLEGRLKRLAVSVASPWEFYLPLAGADDIDQAGAERVWHYQSPLRDATYAADGPRLGDTAGAAHLCVGGDGTVYPAVLMAGHRAAVCGNVRTQTLAEIWFNSPMLSELRGLERSDLADPCSGCAEAAWCGGGSRARALGLAGDLRSADPTCPLSQRAALAA